MDNIRWFVDIGIQKSMHQSTILTILNNIIFRKRFTHIHVFVAITTLVLVTILFHFFFFLRLPTL